VAAPSLPRIIETQGYTTSAIAKDTGKSRSYVSLIVRGKRPVKADDAERIARFLRLPLDIIFMEEES